LYRILIFQVIILSFFVRQEAFPADPAIAQYTEIMAIHPKAGAGYNIYKSSFVNFQGSIDCGLFESGSGFGYSAGLFTEKEILNGAYIGLGLSYVDRGGILIIENPLPFREIEDFESNNVKLENQLSADISFFEINPEFRYTLFDDFINGPFRIFAGFRLAFPVNRSFSQKEVIVSPDDQVFDSTNSRERLIAEGDITSIQSLHYGFSAGIENLLKIGKHTHFTQQLIFDYNLNDVCKDINWTVYALRLELGIRFGIMEENELIIPEIPEIDTVKTLKVDTLVLEPFLSIQFTDEKPDLYISSGDELLATLPLVNAVFFNTNSSDIPDNYLQKDTMMPSFFYGDAVKKRKYVLLKIADIVKKNPNAKIIIIGSTSGLENEAEGLELARKRADNVKNVFKGLGISENLISTSYNILPQSPSNPDFEEGVLENQRADILIQNAPLQEYVGFQKFAEANGLIKIQIDFENLPEINEVILEPFFYDTMIVCSKPGIYTIPVKKRIDINKNSFRLSAEVSYRNIIKNADTAFTVKDFNTIQKELLLENFRAVLRFDYNSAVLSTENKELLNQLISKIPKNAEIIIKGSADALGTEQQNIELANQRAKVAEDYINKITNSGLKIEIENKFVKFPEQTPEGRFFNRAISIEIK
ncbi:OmpA family protein, partial [Bacteroidota bacterium]